MVTGLVEYPDNKSDMICSGGVMLQGLDRYYRVIHTPACATIIC